jgi:hypothetical protein
MKPGAVYNSVSRGVSLLMDGGRPYSFDGVLWRPPSVGGFVEVFRFGLGYGQIQNRTGVTLNGVGFGARLHPSGWKAGQWTASSSTFTDDTSDAQSAAAGDFPLETLTGGDGFLVAALWRFGAICLDISTASVGGTPVRVIEYSKGDGTWATLNNALVPPVTGGHWPTGENLILFMPPSNWEPMLPAHGTGVPVGYYGVRVRATTAPSTTAAAAASLSVAQVVLATGSLANNNILEFNPGSGEFYFDGACDALVAILSSKAAQQSMVHAEVRVL